MMKPIAHLFVCGAVPGSGAPPCSCNPEAAAQLVQFLKHEVSERELHGVMVTGCECMGQCEHSPVVIAYPDGDWYGKVDHQAAGEILEAVKEAALRRSASGCSGCHR